MTLPDDGFDSEELELAMWIVAGLILVACAVDFCRGGAVVLKRRAAMEPLQRACWLTSVCFAVSAETA
jgi:hypothetical protein